MERHHIWDSGSNGGVHRDGCDKRVVTLTMDDVYIRLTYDSVYRRCPVKVTFLRPGRHSNYLHSIQLFSASQVAGTVSRQDDSAMTCGGKPTGDFVRVELSSAHPRKVSVSDEEDSQRFAHGGLVELGLTTARRGTQSAYLARLPEPSSDAPSQRANAQRSERTGRRVVSGPGFQLRVCTGNAGRGTQSSVSTSQVCPVD